MTLITYEQISGQELTLEIETNIYPADPSVGIFNEWCEIGRIFHRTEEVTHLFSDEELEDIAALAEEQIFLDRDQSVANAAIENYLSSIG